MDYCALSALIQKESSFNKLAVSFPPPNNVNTSASPPSYGLTFGGNGHAIGLTQILIKGGSTRDGGEFGFKKALTVQDLIDPETSISAGAYYFGKFVQSNKNNLRIAYDDYQSGPGDTGAPGKPDSDPKTLDRYMQIYNSCKKRG